MTSKEFVTHQVTATSMEEEEILCRLQRNWDKGTSEMSEEKPFKAVKGLSYPCFIVSCRNSCYFAHL